MTSLIPCCVNGSQVAPPPRSTVRSVQRVPCADSMKNTSLKFSGSRPTNCTAGIAIVLTRVCMQSAWSIFAVCCKPSFSLPRPAAGLWVFFRCLKCSVVQQRLPYSRGLIMLLLYNTLLEWCWVLSVEAITDY